jgi:two-component system, OmpR family, response regulator
LKILALTTRSDLSRRLTAALRPPHFVLDLLEKPDPCLDLMCSRTYRGILVDVSAVGFRVAKELVENLRQACPSVAIVVVERQLDLTQRINFFEAGADECLREPFFASELAIRLALLIRLRTNAGSRSNHLEVSDLVLDLDHRQARRAGKVVDLRPREFLLLEYLARNANRPVTRAMILEHVWNSSFEGLTNVVDVYISGLRSKIDRDFSQKLIVTTRGVGYKLVSKPNPSQPKPTVLGNAG